MNKSSQCYHSPFIYPSPHTSLFPFSRLLLLPRHGEFVSRGLHAESSHQTILPLSVNYTLNILRTVNYRSMISNWTRQILINIYADDNSIDRTCFRLHSRYSIPTNFTKSMLVISQLNYSYIELGILIIEKHSVWSGNPSCIQNRQTHNTGHELLSHVRAKPEQFRRAARSSNSDTDVWNPSPNPLICSLAHSFSNQSMLLTQFTVSFKIWRFSYLCHK